MLALLLYVPLLSGCSDTRSEHAWQHYQAQLNAQLETPPVPIPAEPLPQMPRASSLRLEIEPFRISLLTSLRMDSCRLGQLLAQRNSTLGMAQSPSARLRYELDSIQAIDECLQSSIADNPRMATMLQEALLHKTNTLPLYIDQALTRGEEMRYALRALSAMHSTAEETDFTQTLEALRYLNDTFQTALSGQFSQLDLTGYNRHFQTLARSDFLPRHWRTMQQISARLTTLNATLQRISENIAGADCNALSDTYDIYTTELEPMLNQWLNWQQQLEAPLKDLAALSVQDEWQVYIAQLIGESSAGYQATELSATHQGLWQSLLEQCGELAN